MAEWTVARIIAPVVLAADLACMNWLWVATVAVWILMMKGVVALMGR